MTLETEGISARSRGVALALAVILGPFGAHRFYVGKTKSALLMLCTLGGAGLWYLYDLIMVAGGSFRDSQGKLVANWDPERPFPDRISEDLMEELAQLRGDVAELAERVDFAERLLILPRDREGSSSLSGPDAL